MFRKVLVLVAVVLAFGVCDLHAVELSWDGGGDGSTWGDAFNWDPNIVPNSADANVYIEGSAVISIDGIYTINTLNISGDWVILTQGSFTNGHLLDIKGVLANHTELELFDVSINGNLNNLTGAELEVGGDIGTFWGDIINMGEIYIAPGDELWTFDHFGNSGRILIHNGECGAETTFTNLATGIIEGSGVIYGDVSFQNTGEIYASGGALVLKTDSTTFTNTGIIGTKPHASFYVEGTNEIYNQGLFEINPSGGIICDCNLTNDPDGNIQINGGTLAATTITQTADANFAGFGTLSGDIQIDPNGLISLTGPTNIVGDMTIDPNATLEISDGTTLITGHTTCNNGTIHMKGGRVIPQGGFTNNDCNIIWEPGTYNNIADFNLDGQVNFEDFADFADTWLWLAQL